MSKLTASTGFYGMLKLLEEIQNYDFALPEPNDSNLSLIKTHAVLFAVKRSFTKYAVSYMLTEILASFKLKLEVRPDSNYKIKEPNDMGGRKF